MNTAPFNGANLNASPEEFLQGSITDYLENKLIDHIFRGQAYVPPATVYVGLLLDPPEDNGTYSEVSTSGTNYTRVGVVGSLTAFCGTQGTGTTEVSSGTEGVISNNSPVTFGTPSASWGEIKAFGVFDAATDGNLLVYGLMKYPKQIGYGDPGPKFPASTLSITAR